MQHKAKVLVYAGIGYAAAVVTSTVLPEMLSLLLPFAGAAFGLFGGSSRRSNLPGEALPGGAEPSPSAHPLRTAASAAGTPADAQAAQAGMSGAPAYRSGAPAGETDGGRGEPAASIQPEFAPVVEYLSILEDMIISEGQKNTLDNEIVEKSLALFARLQRVIPLLQELGNGEINHTVRRLILKDLNGVINPFLRLSGEAKTRNRRTLLNGLKDIDSKITEIASTIEHKDLLELQSKAELIHQRYNSAEL
ncbi:hypothetical protein [Paenibacillus rhizophilus]|uniref:Uncharacterized protein n=1 Tax=Paenibacillus rhizophilus TaxID=1850366 RepID=A0A3N9P5E2_9BACL|nr:hypothetical protein [Paenibacillus rhizophilus]RQW10979.1 hypothetical protein EH198_14380 [Paenibacillus rhizophilus]